MSTPRELQVARYLAHQAASKRRMEALEQFNNASRSFEHLGMNARNSSTVMRNFNGVSLGRCGSCGEVFRASVLVRGLGTCGRCRLVHVERDSV